MQYLTKADLEKRLYGIERYRPGDPSTLDLHFGVSSGTTTGPPSVHIAYRPVLEFDEIYREWFVPLQGGVVRVLRNPQSALQHAIRALITEVSDRYLYLEERDFSKENFIPLMRDFEPAALSGSPTRVLQWAQAITVTSERALLRRIRFVHLVGELLTPYLRSLLRERLPHAVLKNAYNFSGGNFPTTPCPSSDGDSHHLIDSPSVSKLSIIKPDEDGIGEIVITTPTLQNFRSGDLGKLDPTPCSCGKSPVLTLHGRKDFDRVAVLGAVFLKVELERVLGPFMDAFDDFRLVVGQTLKEATFVGTAEFLYVPNSTAVVNEQELGTHLSNNLFISKTRTLAEIVKAGIFDPLIIKRVQSIPRAGKEVRLKKA